MSALPHIGCPVWACAAWRGSLYTRAARRQDFLPQYARVFGAVEGNSTFYGLPERPTVARWAEEAPPGFRFCFKFPQVVTHRMLLRYADVETFQFLACVEPLRDRLGPLLLQLPPNFAGSDLAVLETYLDTLPAGLAYAVEVRHPDWYDEGVYERALDDALARRGIARVNFDARDLFAETEPDESEREAQHKKPRLPHRATVTNGTAIVRFVGRNRAERSHAALLPWIAQLAAWAEQGVEAYFFTHAPDDAFAPPLARMAHGLACGRIPEMTPLPAFPGETEPPEPPPQLDLFGAL